MRARGRLARIATSAVTGLAVVLVAATASSASAAPTPTFSPITTYAAPTNVPGDLSCVRSGYCMELAYSLDAASLASSVTALSSDDAGASWTRVGGQLMVGSQLLGAQYHGTIQCVVAQVCFLFDDGVLQRTDDGGARWTRLTGLVGYDDATPVVTCLASGACIALVATRSGESTRWLASGTTAFRETDAHELGDVTPTTISCATARRCVAVGVDPKSITTAEVYVTGDAGPTAKWVEAPSVRRRRFADVSCPTVSACFGIEVTTSPVKQHWTIVRSLDGGVQWKTVGSADGAQLGDTAIPALTQVSCSSRLVCVASGGGGASGVGSGDANAVVVKTTTDGGSSWHATRIADMPYVGGVSGYAACSSGTTCVADAFVEGNNVDTGLVATTSNGTSWTDATPPTNATAATGIACSPADSTCYRIDAYESSAGSGARLLVSPKGGAKWSRVALPADLVPVVFGGCQSSEQCELFALQLPATPDGLLGIDDPHASLVEYSTENGWSSGTTSTIATGMAPVVATCSSTTSCVVLGDELPLGTSAFLYSTTTGSTWTSTSVPPPPSEGADLIGLGLYPTALSCSTSGRCLFVDTPSSGDQVVKASDNTGASWSSVSPLGTTGSQVLGGVYCSGITCDVAFEDNDATSYFAQTMDNGSTWSTTVEIGSTPEHEAPELACADVMACTVVSPALETAPIVRQTIDGGAKWTSVTWGGLRLSDAGFDGAGLLACSPSNCLVEAESDTVISQFRGVASDFQLLGLAT